MTHAEDYIDDGVVLFTVTQETDEDVKLVIGFNIPCQHCVYRENSWRRGDKEFLEFHTPSPKTPPSLEQIKRALEEIAHCSQGGGKTLIKSYSKACRSAALMACYLMIANEWSCEESVERLQSMIPTLSFTQPQLDRISEFKVFHALSSQYTLDDSN